MKNGDRLSMCLDLDEIPASGVFLFIFIFFSACVSTLGDKVHCSRDPQPLIQKKNLKIGPTALFTFKNYFVTVFSIFNKISCLQTNPKKHHPTNNQKNLKKKKLCHISKLFLKINYLKSCKIV